MTLCPHVYRRGGIYWWRRVFTVSPAETFVISLSMRLRNPHAARRLGARLTVGADGIVSRIGEGRMQAEDARPALEAIVFEFAEDALVDLQPRPQRTEPPAAPYNAAQERAMLLALGRKCNAHVRSQAVSCRSCLGADDWGQPEDFVTAEIAFAFVYLLIGARGNAASVTDRDRADMAARGLARYDIAYVERAVAAEVRNERGTTWTLGPDRDFYIAAMEEHGVAPSEVALECGYPLSSLKERIYAGTRGRTDRYGILIYTSTAGGQGTLGGLSSMADRVPMLLLRSMTKLMLCSNDPICAEHSPAEEYEDRCLHGAACHACLLVPETSCEARNSRLDRSLLVQTVFAGSSALLSGI